MNKYSGLDTTVLLYSPRTTGAFNEHQPVIREVVPVELGRFKAEPTGQSGGDKVVHHQFCNLFGVSPRDIGQLLKKNAGDKCDRGASCYFQGSASNNESDLPV